MRTYKPRPKVIKFCKCGCGLRFAGTVSKEYLNPTHKIRQYHRDHPRDQSKKGKDDAEKSQA